MLFQEDGFVPGWTALVQTVQDCITVVVCLTKPSNKILCFLEYVTYHPNLVILLRNVGSVNTQSIAPQMSVFIYMPQLLRSGKEVLANLNSASIYQNSLMSVSEVASFIRKYFIKAIVSACTRFIELCINV